jgi:hypothetical protein
MKGILKPLNVNICLRVFLSKVLKCDDFSPLLFNFVSEYSIRRVKENQVKLKLSGMH